MEEEKVVIETDERHFDAKSLIVPLLIIFLVIGTIVGISNYISKRNEATAPNLEITTPADEETVEEAQIVVGGNTNNKAKVTVNGEEVEVDKTGEFSKEVALKEGENQIGIVAENRSGKKSEANLKVTRKSATPEVTTPVETPAAQPVAGADLTSAGPENFFIPEISVLSFAGAGWYASRKRLLSQIKNK